MYPAILVICTVKMTQIERTNCGILKMRALPISLTRMCLSKFVILMLLGLIEILICTVAYYISAKIASIQQNYSFVLSPEMVFKVAGLFYISSIPMMAFFWMLSVLSTKPVVCVVIGLMSIVPSVLVINTKYWFFDPISYAFYFMTAQYGKMAENITEIDVNYMFWVPAAILLTGLFLIVSMLRIRSEKLIEE